MNKNLQLNIWITLSIFPQEIKLLNNSRRTITLSLKLFLFLSFTSFHLYLHRSTSSYSMEIQPCVLHNHSVNMLNQVPLLKWFTKVKPLTKEHAFGVFLSWKPILHNFLNFYSNPVGFRVMNLEVFITHHHRWPS